MERQAQQEPVWAKVRKDVSVGVYVNSQSSVMVLPAALDLVLQDF